MDSNLENLLNEVIIMQHKCLICDYVYDEEKGDPENGIAPGTKWEDVPEDFLCPDCAAGKADFD